MFVSSYSTYIQMNTSDKNVKGKEQSARESTPFTLKLLDAPTTEAQSASTLPIDYVNKAKSFNTKLEITRQEEALKNPENEFIAKSKELTKEFMGNKILQNAKNAYEDSTKVFSFSKKPHVPLGQTPQADSRLPEDIQKIQEANIRHIMVNTYAQNDKYYKITAA